MPLRDIDFVLVWDGSPNSPGGTEDSFEKRRIFERNLEEEGLIIEREKMDGNNFNFVKIHAPIEVLKRYTEILKIRRPMIPVGKLLCYHSFTLDVPTNDMMR